VFGFFGQDYPGRKNKVQSTKNKVQRPGTRMDPLADRNILDVKIERLLPGGVGLAHSEGQTIFVSLAAPGDVLRVEIERTRGKVAFASIRKVLEPSSVRMEPPCPYFGLCGGCDFQQLTYEAQLATKVEIIRDCLHRIAQIELPSELKIHPAPKQWQYRTRANWQADAIRNRLGYFARGSNDVCDVEYCAVLVPEVQETLERVRAELLEGSMTLPLKNIEAVGGDEGVSVAPSIGELQTTVVSRRIGTETYHFSAESFFQINNDLLEPLLVEALCESDNDEGNLAIDLYCGVGLFTVPLARRFERVVGIEANSRATEFARQNLEFAKLENAAIVTSRVGDWLQQYSRTLGAVDFLLLDPPRTGAENRDIAGILALRPRQISYVSCDPATLARDLKKLIAAGYALDSVVAFDIFPQTHHVETVVRLHLNS
ncbi:MAG: class I SAM-dependent RNA methyltransferase, partial [Acidobacteriota bacterium]